MECYELQLYSYASFKDALAAGSSSPARQKLSQLKWVSRPTKLRLCTWKACARKAGGRSLDVEGDQNQKKNEEGPLKGLAPLVVVGSANADIYVEIDRLPAPGETIAAHAGRTLPGGKGANQAACAAHLSHPTFFVGQVGEDAHGNLLRQSLRTYGVNLEYLNSVTEPTGHAVVMLQPGGQNSIIIVGGANVSWTRTKNTSSHFSPHIQQLICGAGAILLQREIPDIVNIEAAKIACSANVPVILDVGGADTPIPEEFLQYVSVLSPNETELARLTGAPVNTIEDCIQAARQCQKMGVKQVLIKLGERGSALLTEDGNYILQSVVPAPVVVDTTGAGDTFTAAYAVAMVEGESLAESLKFASAAASLCIQVKGAMPSMPDRKSVDKLLHQIDKP